MFDGLDYFDWIWKFSEIDLGECSISNKLDVIFVAQLLS